MAYGCKCNCENFREHVGFGPTIDGRSLPTRSRATELHATQAQWEKDGAAYHRLAKDGYKLQNLDGAAEIEARATQPVELTTGKIFGEKAKTIQKIASGETA